jgi:diguanylate cyclase (GGDEF)-like protein
MNQSLNQSRSRLQRWLIGDRADYRWRQDVLFVLVTGYYYAVCAGASLHAQALGVMAAPNGSVLAATQVGAWLLYYGLVRSGWSRRFRDPALIVPHVLASNLLMAQAYVLIGPTRGNMLLLFALPVVSMMFRMSPRQIAGVSAYSAVVLVLAMLWVGRHADEALRLNMTLQAAVAISCLTAMAWVAGAASRLRLKRVAQREALHQALAQARDLAQRDMLTGVSNRRHMEEVLERRTAACTDAASGRSLALAIAIVDIDFFKAINDTHGHRAGDEVLRRLAGTLGDRLQPDELLARWGGEEFLLMLPGRDAGPALAFIESLRAQVAGQALDDIAQGLRLSFSAGVSQWQPGEPVERTIDRADNALYAAKRAGRNRCVHADDGLPQPSVPMVLPQPA